MHIILASSMIYCSCTAAAPLTDVPLKAPHIVADLANQEFSQTLDPKTTFDQLISRYKDISTYEDRVIIEQVTARDGQPAVREQTTVHCAIDEEGELNIKTDAEFQEDVATPTAANDDSKSHFGNLSALQMQYQLWLAPHMALRFQNSPLESFRSGIEEGFTPVAAERVTVADEELLRLDLQSGDGLSGDFRAKFELFINPDTMLIRRVRGVQLLPDGANLLTDFHITPKRVVTMEGEEITPSIRRIGAAV